MNHETTEGRKARRKELRSEHVLAVASRVFAVEGLEGLTLGRVARELDLVPAALYRYFASKDELVAAMQRRAVGELTVAFRAHLAKVEATLQGRSDGSRALGLVFAMGRFYLALPKHLPDTWRLVAVLLADPRALLPDVEAARVIPMIGEFLSIAEGVLTSALEAGTIEGKRDSVRLRTLQLWASMHGALCLEKLKRFGDGAGLDVGGAILDDLLRGWGAEPAAIARAKRALQQASEA